MVQKDKIIMSGMIQYMKSMTELNNVLVESVDLYKKRVKQEEELNTYKDEEIKELNLKIDILNRTIKALEETNKLQKEQIKQKKYWFFSWLRL